MNLHCVYCGKPVAEEWPVCCGEVGHTEPDDPPKVYPAEFETWLAKGLADGTLTYTEPD